MKLTFHGGVGQVTGANYLLESGKTKILIDCGLVQGCNLCEDKNWDDFPYEPTEIDAVLVTHSHIDHIGRLPKLYKDGFLGRIHSTSPCRDFSELLLYDSQHVLSLEAKEKKKPFLYEEKDVNGLMRLWRGHGYYHPFQIGDFKITFYNAGHILGSSFILVEAEGKKIIFSGDLGNSPAPIIGDKDKLPRTDYCLLESTYGDRFHEDLEIRRDILEDVIEETIKAGGVLMIPAFAMERTQQLLFEINNLIKGGRIQAVPVFLDSPLAIKVTEIYKKYRIYFSKEIIEGVNPDEPIIDIIGLNKTLKTEESKAIERVAPPKIIIAGSGMMQGGRILHHLKDYLPDKKSTLLIAGYQADGSLGRLILDGKKSVKIMGEMINVRAKIIAIGGYSAHADQGQLMDWIGVGRDFLKKVFIVQGEELASLALWQKIRDELVINAEMPAIGKTYKL